MHQDPTGRRDEWPVSTTAYIAWAVFHDDRPESRKPCDPPVSSPARAGRDRGPLRGGLVANALLAMDPAAMPQPYIVRLEQLCHTRRTERSWWEKTPRADDVLRRRARRQVETTALAALAMIPAMRIPARCAVRSPG